jgi:hypothetical protein
MAFNFQRLEHVRIALALVAAVITGGAALYGVYHNAREATAASYETLAPEINQLKQAVTRLQAENQELRQSLGSRQPGPALARATSGSARSAPRRTRAEPAPRNAPAPATLPETPPGTPPPPATTPPATPPPATPPPAPPAEPQRPGGVEGEIQRRVPIDFEKAREVWKQVKKLPRPQ